MLPKDLERELSDPARRKRLLFSSELLSRLESYTGLPPGEIAEILVDLTIEKFAVIMGTLLASSLGKPSREVESKLVDLLTSESDIEPEGAVKKVIMWAGREPGVVLKTMNIDQKLETARLEAVEELIQNYSHTEGYKEEIDPRRAARIRISKSGLQEKEAGEEYWSGPASKKTYLSPEEIAKEKSLEKEIRKRGKSKEFKKWSSKLGKIDWAKLEKRAEEAEKRREKALLGAMVAKTRSLASQAKTRGGVPEPEEEVDVPSLGKEMSDRELDALLAKNPLWKQAVEMDPSWREKLKKNPILLDMDMEDVEEFQEGAEPGLKKYPLVKPEEERKLAQVAARIRPGGLRLPLDYYLWRLQSAREEQIAANPKLPDESLIGVDAFIADFFEIDQSKGFNLEDLWKYGQEKGLSKRRLADLVNVSPQTLTVRSKELRDREDLQDPEAVVRYLEPRRRSAGIQGTSRIPDWVVDLFLPPIVKADDFVSDVSFLADKFIGWNKNPEIRRRIEGEIEKRVARGERVSIDWEPRDNLKAFAVAMDIVGKKMATKISKEIIEELDVALMEIDQHLSKERDPEILSPAGEGSIDWRLALRRFLDPRIDGVLARFGVGFVAPGPLLKEYKDAVRYLVLKHIRKGAPGEGEKVGKGLFTDLERQTYKLLTDKQILSTFIGGVELNPRARSLLDKGRHLIKPSLRAKLTPDQDRR